MHTPGQVARAARIQQIALATWKLPAKAVSIFVLCALTAESISVWDTVCIVGRIRTSRSSWKQPRYFGTVPEGR